MSFVFGFRRDTGCSGIYSTRDQDGEDHWSGWRGGDGPVSDRGGVGVVG